MKYWLNKLRNRRVAKLVAEVKRLKEIVHYHNKPAPTDLCKDMLYISIYRYKEYGKYNYSHSTSGRLNAKEALTGIGLM